MSFMESLRYRRFKLKREGIVKLGTNYSGFPKGRQAFVNHDLYSKKEFGWEFGELYYKFDKPDAGIYKGFHW